MTVIEFWPDHGPGPLWLGGRAVRPEDLDIPEPLASRLRTWNASYEEWKIPVEGSGDALWIEEGIRLLQATREALSPDVEVVVTEPWWGEEPIS